MVKFNNKITKIIKYLIFILLLLPIFNILPSQKILSKDIVLLILTIGIIYCILDIIFPCIIL